jgi:hypothetical protein
MKQDSSKIPFDIEFNQTHFSKDDYEREKPNLNLTISVILHLNNIPAKILDIREEIARDLDSTEEISEDAIYKYRLNTLHFSAINFIGLKGEDSPERLIKSEYPKVEKIKSILEKNSGKNISDRSLDFRYIYTGRKGKKKDVKSMALQVYPSIELCRFFEDLKVELSEHSLGDIEIKSNDNRFTLNLIRFFRELNYEEKNIICGNVKNINEKSEKSVLCSFELKRLSFVVSDNWLANDNPELYYINMN